jgi:hypothetical protein
MGYWSHIRVQHVEFANIAARFFCPLPIEQQAQLRLPARKCNTIYERLPDKPCYRSGLIHLFAGEARLATGCAVFKSRAITVAVLQRASSRRIRATTPIHPP